MALDLERVLVAVILARRTRQAQERDPYLVVVEPLAEALSAFLNDWNLNHPQIAGQWGLDPDAPIPMRGTEWLAGEAGLDEELIKSIRRRSVHAVELRVFDRLCAAMDCPHLLHDHRVSIFHNPGVEVQVAA